MGGANNNSKSELRREFGGRWRGQDPRDVATCSRAVCAQVVSSPVFARTEHLVAYAARPWEVDPLDVVRQAEARRRATYYPRVDGDHLRFHRAGPEDLVPGRFGILEPPADHPRLDGAVDRVTILIPGLAFDRSGTRLGSGGGFYDRALRETGRATRIGLAFREGVVDHLPRDPWDVAMDLIATEDGIFTTGAHAGVAAGDA